MKHFKRFFALLLVATLLISALSISASAAYYDADTTSGQGSYRFNNAWEKTRTYKTGNTTIGQMIYGYDTDWINEDYVWTKANECYSRSYLFRDGYDTGYGSDDSSDVGKGKYSKTEWKHRTYYVNYRIKLSATYSNVTYTTKSSSVK